MKSLSYLLLTLVTSSVALYGAFHFKNHPAFFIIAVGIWAVYFWYTCRRIKKAAARQAGERLFEEHMRSSVETRIRF